MKFKPLPEPPDSLEAVFAVRRAVPRIPAPESDCCARVASRVRWIGSRDEARDWLTLLRALGLVERGPTGLRRTDGDEDRGALADRFVEGVYGADRALAAVTAADGPVDPATLADGIGGAPTWERYRRDDWQAGWTERTERLLEWFALLGLAERMDDRYRAIPRVESGIEDG